MVARTGRSLKSAKPNMANGNNPFGLMYLGLYGGSPNNASSIERRNGILYTNSTAIYSQDLLKQSANGYLYQWSAGTAADQCWGVFDGCRFLNNFNSEVSPSKYWPGTGAASGSVLAQLYPGLTSPSAVYAIQTDSTGITVADIGATADIVVGSGSTLTGKSGSYLDTTTLTTTSYIKPLVIMDLWANWQMGGPVEGAASPSGLVAGTQAGAYNWAVVAINTSKIVGI